MTTATVDDLLKLRGIVEDAFELMNARARRDGLHRPEDCALEKDIDARLLALHEKLVTDWGDHLEQERAEVHLQNTTPVGNA